MDATSDTERRPAQPTAHRTDSHVRTRVLVLGPLQIEHDGRTVHIAGTHRRRLLALLASRSGQVVGTDAIIDALWGDDPPPSAAKTIQSHVARLRASLAEVGRELIETTPAGYRLAANDVEVDADAFARAAGHGHRRLEARDLTGAAAVLEDALALWRGPPFADFPDAEFAVHERTRLTELHATAVEDLAEVRLESGAAAVVAAELERLVAADPGRERAWGLLMRALYASGRQQDALVAYQRARRSLAEHFGLEPGPELRALERRVLEQDPDLAVAQREVMPAALRPAGGDFVGHSTERAWLVEAWQAARQGRGQLRIVLGAADSGRTRLAAEVASAAAGDHGAITYVQGSDGVIGLLERDRQAAAGSPSGGAGGAGRPGASAVVEAVTERSRQRPQLIVVDDVEWANAPTMEALRVLAAAVERLPVLLMLIADPAGGGPAVQALASLDPSTGVTTTLAPLSDDELARIIAADGIDDPAAVAAIVSVAAGRPGVARREAAAWAEQAAGDRLHRAAAASAGALAAADEARVSVVEEVARLVRARARRHELTNAAWIGRQPYRGLASYGPADADVFVGREHLVAELATRVLDRRLVVVTGASGSGKSSLVRAGLVPLVESGHLPGQGPWRVNVMVPGPHPRRALDALPGLDERDPQLLVVDQFEECFHAPPAATDAFVARLLDLALDPALDAHLVLVVRADQYGGLTDLRGLSGLLDGAQVTVGRPSEDELRRIVEEPAARAGCRVEPLLVATVLDDVGGTDGTLPLVSTTLAELWEHRDGDTLTAERYHEQGGLAASIERLGERILATGDHGRQLDEDTARRALLLLTDITDDGGWVRRRLHADEIPPALSTTIDALVDGRLLVRDDDVVEIAHEVVFRAWPRLQGWLEAARNDLVLGRDVRAAARAWDEQGRSDDDVYRGARLALATEWADRHPDAMTPVVAEFVAAGRAEADRARLDAEAQLARERRAGRRLRRALVAASLLLVLALIATAIALVSRQRAGDERDRANEAAARADEAAARADEASAQAQDAAELAEERREEAENERDQAQLARLVAESERSTESRPDLAMLLAVEAYRRSETPATKGALLSALAGQTSVGPASGASALELLTSVPTSFRGFVTTGLESPVALSISADGTRFTVGANESHTSGEVLVVYDVATGREIRRITGEARGTGRALGAQISPDGTYVMIANTDVINAWSVADGTVRAIARAGPVEFAGASLAPDGTLIAASVGDGSIAVFDPATGATVDVGELPVAVPGLVAFIPDGRLAIGLAAPEPGLLLWDVVARRESVRVTLEVPAAPLTPPLATYTFSPDGTRLILAISDDGPSLFVWDVASGRLIGDATKRPRVVRNAPVFVSSQVAAIGHVDGSITYYDFVDEEVVAARSDAHGGGIWALASTPDGTTLLSGSDDGTVGIWGRGEHGLIDEPLLRGGQVVSVSADGTRYAVVGRDGVVRVGTVDGGALIEVPVPSSLPGKPAAWVALSADGSRVAVEVDYGDGRTVPFVADAATGRTVWQGAIIQPVAAAVPSEDGSLVYTLTPDQRVLLATEVTTGRPVATRVADSIEDDAAFGEEISPTPDGRFVDMLLPNSIARLDARTLERIAAVPVDEVLQGNIVAIPGTDQVVAVGRLGRIVRVDMVTGEVVTGRSRDSSSLGGLAIDAGGEVVAAVHPFAGTIALFDTATLQPIGLPIPALAAIYNPGFLSGGQLVGATPIGISRWEMNPEEWRRIACRSAGRNLTQAEWSEYLGDEPYRPTCPDWPAATD